MSSNQQQELTPEGVLADIGYRGFVQKLLSRSGDPSKDMAHALLGVATELNELKHATEPVNSLEELGDLKFYGTAVLNLAEEFLGENIEHYCFSNFGEYLDNMYEQLCETYTVWDLIDDARTSLLDHAKRWVGYGKQPDLRQLALETLVLVMFAEMECNFPEEDDKKIRLANVAKLLLRYKGLEFKAEHAANRDTAAERELMESHAA